MFRKIIFFVASPFNKRDYKRYGVDVLIQNGFEVFIYDFSPIVHPKLYKAGMSDPIEYQNHFQFFNKDIACKKIYSISDDTFVICMMLYNKKRFWIYRTLSRSNVPYAVPLTMAVPEGELGSKGITTRNENQLLNNIIGKLTRISFNKFLSLPYKIQFSRYLGILPPHFIIVGGKEAMGNYKKSCPVANRTEIVRAHTLDYDIYLELKESKPVGVGNPVFIDPGALNKKGDHLARDVESVWGSGNYFKNLCSFFEIIEKKNECVIDIAAHPGYLGKKYPTEFNKRLMVVNETARMISNASFVITHNSTAICFAVLFNKPIVFITTDECDQRYEGVTIKQMASWFGKSPINIDHEINVDWKEELRVEEFFYRNYKDCFIISEGSEEINTWQIVANKLKKM